MPTTTDVTRRSFMQMIGSSSLLGLAGGLTAFGASPASNAQRARFAYVASSDGDVQGIHIFDVANGRWVHTQFVPSQAPAALALSPDSRVLFVANRVSRYRGLPTASVEAYRVEAGRGTLTLINRQALGLSAIHPEHLAVSPDGKYLAVSVTGGGAYNLLPIDDDGSLLPVMHLRKELGAGSHPVHQTSSRPQQILFDGAGRLLTTDLGTDRVSVFDVTGEGLLLKQRAAATPEAGPSMVSMAGSHSHLLIGNALDGTITSHEYDQATGFLAVQQSSVQAIAAAGDTLSSLAVHPQRNFVYSATRGEDSGEIVAWDFDANDGSLTQNAKARLHGELTSLVFSGDGESLFALDVSNGVILAIAHDAASTKITTSALADVATPTALTILYS